LKFVAGFLEKPVEQSGGSDQDVSARVSAHVHELVRNAARQEGALARGQQSRLAADHRSQLAFDDVNRLVILGWTWIGVLVFPALLFSNRQNCPAVCSPDSRRFMTTPARTNSLLSISLIVVSFPSQAEIQTETPPTESGCAGHGSQLWKNHELDFEHDALVVGLLIAAC
jgi:hypothetical protein